MAATLRPALSPGIRRVVSMWYILQVEKGVGMDIGFENFSEERRTGCQHQLVSFHLLPLAGQCDVKKVP